MTDDIETIEQQETKEYLNRQKETDYKNSLSDLGHSYSYMHEELDKIRANFDLTEPKLRSLINKYQNIIKEDQALHDNIGELLNLSTKLKSNINDNTQDIEHVSKLFNLTLELIERLAEEEQRIEEESPLSKDLNQQKSSEYFELKANLLQIQQECFTKF
ncbi:MAG: hypothetical protein ACK4OM_00985 [Alphaproteobacteria bacterium]